MLNTDFPNYYLVARLLREGYSLDRIYDWIWLQRIKDHWGLDQALVGFAGLTPFSALPVVPLALFPAIVAKRLWILANVLFLGSSVELLSRVTTLGRRRVWLLALLAIFPLRTSFLFGQMHLLVLLLLASAYYFHRKGKADCLWRLPRDRGCIENLPAPAWRIFRLEEAMAAGPRYALCDPAFSGCRLFSVRRRLNEYLRHADPPP